MGCERLREGTKDRPQDPPSASRPPEARRRAARFDPPFLRAGDPRGPRRCVRDARPKGLAQVAEPAEPACVLDLEVVPRPAAGLPAAQALDSRPDLGDSLSRSRRKSRMVEISLSGSERAPAGATGRGYSTGKQRSDLLVAPAKRLGQRGVSGPRARHPGRSAAGALGRRPALTLTGRLRPRKRPCLSGALCRVPDRASGCERPRMGGTLVAPAR